MMMTSVSHQQVHCAPAAAQWLGYRYHSYCAADGGLGLACYGENDDMQPDERRYRDAPGKVVLLC